MYSPRPWNSRKAPLLLLIPSALVMAFLFFPRSPESVDETPRRLSGPEIEIAAYEELHDPYGVEVPRAVLENMRTQIDRLGDEGGSTAKKIELPWEMIGPQTALLSGVTKNSYYGRVLDFEINVSGVDERVIGPTGHLWWKDPAFPVASRARPIADQLPTFAMGSFDTHPSDPQTILLGTGTPNGREGVNGMGLWRTTDGGANWTQIVMDPLDQSNEPKAFYKLRYDLFNPLRVHAATTNGYWRSDDGGLSWTDIETGTMTDFAQHPFIPDTVFLAEWGCANCASGGIYKSTLGGDAGSWNQLVAGGIPSNNVGRGSITLAGTSTVSLYVSLATADDFTLEGVYRSDDLGATWANISPPAGPAFTNAHRNNGIAANPTVPGTVVLGWITLWRTTNGLSAAPTWTEVTQSEGPAPGTIHPDVWTVQWAMDGSWVGAATDGGLYISFDGGINWKVEEWYPITQFYHIDVDPSLPTRMVGGSQDNGIAVTQDAGIQPVWRFTQSGDGAGVAIQNLVLDPIWAIAGVDAPADLDFHQLYSLDHGATWDFKEENMLPSNQWIRKVRTPRSGNVAPTVVTAAGDWVYQRDQQNQVWVNLNQGAPFQDNGGANVQVADITIVDEFGDLMWVTTKASGLSDDRVMYRDGGGVFHERSSGLPVGKVRKVAGDRYGANPLLGYALMAGLSNDIIGARVWRTTNAGVNWTNITGNLPDVSVTDLIEFPGSPHILYLASEFGCFKTETALDLIPVWFKWNSGMPRAVDVREFSPYFDSGTDEYWIYAGTFGRSAWRRNLASGGGSTPAPVDRSEAFLSAPQPNPFGSSTVLSYRLAAQGPSDLTIYDLRGRAVRTLSVERSPGWHQASWNGRDQNSQEVATGVYFAVLRTGGSRYQQRLAYVR